MVNRATLFLLLASIAVSPSCKKDKVVQQTTTQTVTPPTPPPPPPDSTKQEPPTELYTGTVYDTSILDAYPAPRLLDSLPKVTFQVQHLRSGKIAFKSLDSIPLGYAYIPKYTLGVLHDSFSTNSSNQYVMSNNCRFSLSDTSLEVFWMYRGGHRWDDEFYCTYRGKRFK